MPRSLSRVFRFYTRWLQSLRLKGDQAVIATQQARTEIADLQVLIFRLPPLLREALILVGAQGLSHDEAAAICNVPVGTMKARLSRARAQLSAMAG